MPNDDRVIMITAEPSNGDGYVFATTDPRRAIEQFKEWSTKFGAENVRCNEGFERLARRLIGAGLNRPAPDDLLPTAIPPDPKEI